MIEGELEVLRSEIIRLENELEKTNHQNVKAAELGLLVIEEKQLLHKKVKEIELAYEQSQAELRMLQDAFRRSELQNLKQNQESASEEETQIERNTTQIRELRDHVKFMETELRTLRSEKERVSKDNEELEKSAEKLSSELRAREIEWEKFMYKMRELEKRENKMLADISEIEDENIALQKQMVTVRLNHMECESLRMEMDNLREQKYIQAQKLEESEMLRNILKKQLDETSEMLEREKQMRQATKNEMEELKLTAALPNGQNGPRFKGNKRRCDKLSDEEHQPPMASHYQDYLNLTTNAELTAILMDEDPSLLCGMNGSYSENDGDLFNEMQSSEMDELRSRLEAALAERDDLARQLAAPATVPPKKVTKLLVDAATDTTGRLEDEGACLTSLRKELERKSQALFTREEDIVVVQSAVQAIRRSQLPGLVTRVSSYVKRSLPLPHDRHPVVGTDTEEEDNQPPDPIDAIPNVREAVTALKQDLKALETFLIDKFLPCVPPYNIGISPPYHRHSSVHQPDASEDGIVADLEGSDSEVAFTKPHHDQLLREIHRLKAIIVSKRSKNLHYRSVLQSYKTTAEVCFSKMQAKYAEERQVVSDTLSRYRQELGVYKVDCQTLAGQLSALRTECRELNATNASLRSRVEFLDSERKTLNSMLKTAIQQKFALIQKVESLECFNFFPANPDDDSLNQHVSEAKAAFSRLNGITGKLEPTVYYKNGHHPHPPHHPDGSPHTLLNKCSMATKFKTSSPLASPHSAHLRSGSGSSPRSLTQMFPQISLLSRKAFTISSNGPTPSPAPNETNGAN